MATNKNVKGNNSGNMKKGSPSREHSTSRTRKSSTKKTK